MAKRQKHSWEFTRRFRKGTYGWKSYPAINRIKEAVSEIRKGVIENKFHVHPEHAQRSHHEGE